MNKAKDLSKKKLDEYNVCLDNNKGESENIRENNCRSDKVAYESARRSED